MELGSDVLAGLGDNCGCINTINVEESDRRVAVKWWKDGREAVFDWISCGKNGWFLGRIVRLIR